MFPNIEVRHLHAVVVLAEEMNFTRAAHRLNVTQPALSKQITELEEEYGLHLFNREKGRLIELTESGHIFVEEASAALSHAERAIQLARATEGGCERVLTVGTGRPARPHRIKATLGGITVNGQLHVKNGSYSLTIPKHLNRPGTSEELQRLGRAGTSLTVEHERYSELGARISWLRAGYLALVAMEGYKIVLDPAMDIVRTQIRECDERRMLTFVADAQENFPLTIRRVLRVLEPAWYLGWTVQFGPYLVNLPSLGDMTFYERLANNGLSPTVQHTTYEYVGWPTTPTFGLLQNKTICRAGSSSTDPASG